MRFLLTNDDGIYAEGLRALQRELSQVAECLIVAPETEQSAVGHAITLSQPLMVRRVKREGHFWGYGVKGTPADCVKLGVKELSEKPFDLVVSGINRGANVGINVIYSGTVSAATEGTILGIPSIAVSLDDLTEEADFSFAARFAKKIALFIAKSNHTRGMTLNVNIPAIPEKEIQGIAVTEQGTARLMEDFEKRVDPRENTYYWLAGETLLPNMEKENSDATALKKGFISVTPIHYDLTRYESMTYLETTAKKLFP
ncbi:MAG: 5'/3'-nucleotidase SurE [Deltaproteobacteria bacterium]|nr:5'/3'-nucleotidase SurE [Deltaproteobacteria bacterium]MBN2845511.1 5'/3'-nucleotidase SurE [Deltaproteobacteria bacterium]